MTTNYNMQDTERVLSILNWLDREGLRSLWTLNDEEQECEQQT